MSEPSPEDVKRWEGGVVLEFGASWCPICKGARPMIDRVLATRQGLRHEWVEDGSGKPLGRSFRVKLWPTLVALRDGVEVARVVRPQTPAQVEAVLDAALGGAPSTVSSPA
ncbi:MAG TPA: thioredoxin family protein [Kofleriaceae bacterium]|nr:thioredoxin family protein [Kofleriaceae bacterium]